MSGRKMLREIMTVNDIYAFAEPIMEMLREDYGSYDADSLDEVLVEETFAQRLGARGYDVRSWNDALDSAPEVAPPPPASRPPSGDVVPVTVVRRRPPAGRNERPAGGERSAGPARSGNVAGRAGSAERASGEDRPASAERPSTGSRTRRPTSAQDGERSPASSRTRRSSADEPRAEEAAPTRTRRTTRTPRNNGNTEG